MNSNHAKKLFILLSLMEEMGFEETQVHFNDSVGREKGFFEVNIKFSLTTQSPKKGVKS
jgi:hypothetical protein